MFAFNERAPLSNMLIFHYLADGKNRRTKVIEISQAIPDFLASLAAGPGFDYLFQFGAVLAPRGRCRKARILKQVAPPDQFCRLSPNRIIHVRHAQGEIAVGHFHGAVADLVAGEMFVHGAGHKTKDGFLHGNFDLLALAGALARVERRQDPDRDAHTRGFVTNAQRLGAGGTVVFPRAMEPSGDAIVARRRIAVASVGSPLAIAARAGVNQARIEAFDRIVVQTESLHYSFLVILDEHIGTGDEPTSQIDSFFGL